ncbi:choice-of-anchor I family protein [Paenibacillus lautus]|uniref:Multifunctional 2',3'-cyclic-nucleotide 2'-phosphodiesterase/5'-nucleotidase/3'-nucleotidase n=1 Tax=Paenibacillus lautus TaxID=1401 RepID=A0A385TRD7_PAELA|nr:choice-of-anchor I family protein [Paenibacillus lautus]AYB45991.1 multifunctional 2',3'-cyclic-nucleotide 2'-phosphodiesterase/5'-nucleotidase/3'-nucleotidase [Paenibacillus lautus]
MELKHKSMKVVSLLMAAEITMASLFSGGSVYADEGQQLLQAASMETTSQDAAIAAVDLGITDMIFPDAYAEEPYAVTVDVYGGQAPYTFSATGLPAGLTLASDTGAISGTPAAGQEGEHTVEVTVQDSAALPATAQSVVKLQLLGKRPASVADKLAMKMIGHYSVGTSNKDGGVAEIVKYNKDNGKLYLVNGSTQPASLEIVSIGADGSLVKDKQIHVEDLASTGGFLYGDLTSVDVNTKTKQVVVAVQEQDHTKAGKVLVLDYDGGLIGSYETGVQPDMVKYTSDGRYILTADEGEPRAETAPDPEGSITIIDTLAGEVSHLKFDDSSIIDDRVHIRGNVEADGQIRSTGTKNDAVHDLEPEYIALSEDELTAYVALQENNAIAVVDIASKRIQSVRGLGYKDLSQPENQLDLLKDGQIKFENVPFYGMYMPDGIATYSVNGQQYILSANEGDATGWDDRSNESDIGKMKSNLDPSSPAAQFLAGKGATYDKVEVASDMGHEGLYLYGGRSFSIWNAADLSQVYDSGSDFEKITAERLPNHFNASNDKTDLDSRSAKKGPEPEYVAVGKVGQKTLAFVGLERIGGVMTYDVTDPSAPAFLNYFNSRDFNGGIQSDSGPEGLDFIPASDSITGRPLLLVANEVSGTVALLELQVTKITVDKPSLTLKTGGSPERLQASVETAQGGSADLVWRSSDETVAVVDQNGLVTPISAGEAVITVLSKDGYGSAEVTVKVTDGSPDGEPWKLTVMHTNDTHAHLAEVARRATLVQEIRSEGGNSLLLDAGDVFSGDLYFTKWFGLADLTFMNYMGYDAMTFGNHEFDQGTKTLADFVSKAHFPLVSANVDLSQDTNISHLIRKPAVIDTDQPKTTANNGVYPYTTLLVDGQKVGVFGLTTEDTAETSSPGKDVVFRDAVTSAKAAVEAMEKEGLDKIIALSHLGYAKDLALAEAVEGIDLIVGGHTHTTLNAPEVVTDSQHHTPTVIVQANEWGKFLGRVDLQFDKNGVVLVEDGELGGKLIPVDNTVQEDTQAKDMLAPFKAELEELMKQVIGTAGVVLDGKRENVRSKETNLGNLIADGMLAKAKELKNADIALTNGGGIRAAIDEGDITMGELRTVMPFGNTLFVMDVTGQQLKDGLENGISGAKLADLPGKFPQIAGMKFKWDPNAPAGDKVFDVQIMKDGSYKPLVLTETYRMATNSFVAKGGDGYKSFADAIAEGKYNEDLGYPDYEIFMEYVNKLGGKVSPKVEGRITEQKKPANPGDGSSPGSGSDCSGGGSVTPPTTQPNPPSTGGNATEPNVLTGNSLNISAAAGGTMDHIRIKEEAWKKAVTGLSANGQQELSIRAPELNRAAELSLPAAGLKQAMERNPNATLVLETALGAFRLPITALPLDEALEPAQGSGSIQVKLSVSPAAGKVADAMTSKASSMGASLAANGGLRFGAAVGAPGAEQELKDFGKRVISRIMPLPAGMNPDSLAAVIYDEAAGTFRFVPAVRTTWNGKAAIEIKHAGNGVYALLQYKKTFADLDGHWAKTEIETMASKLLVNGVNADSYAPGKAITRAEFTAMLVRAMGLSPVIESGTFKDVQDHSAYAGEIGAASRYGLIEGGTGGAFSPNASMTRAEMAVMITRAMEAVNPTDLSTQGANAAAGFKDQASIPVWAAAHVASLTKQGIVQGDNNGNFGALDSVTRAQAALVLKRTLAALKFMS